MIVRDDENYYRGLLKSAHKGFEKAKAFLEAVSNSEAAIKNVAIQTMTNPRRSTSNSSNTMPINFGTISSGS